MDTADKYGQTASKGFIGLMEAFCYESRLEPQLFPKAEQTQASTLPFF